MNEETDLIWRALARMLDDLLALAGQLDQANLNRAPDLPGANSAFVIITHVLGNVRSWVLGIVCEQPLDRDRPAEFRSHGTFNELRDQHQALVSACQEALAQLDASSLADRIVPHQVLFGEGETHEMTRREALLHPLEHAAIHVGQMQLTVDMLLEQVHRES